MRQFAICTVYGLYNYGNRLQNYSLQQIIRSIVLSGNTIVESPHRLAPIKRFAKVFLKKENGKILWKTYKDIQKEKADKNRENNFLLFTEQYITPHLISDLHLASFSEHSLDFMIVGSDQVWNPLFWNHKDPMTEFNRYLLTFASSSKRIAYAASFGIPELPSEWEDKFASELSKFKAISVREESGARIVKKLIGKDAPVVLDPTLLLTAQEWRKIETHTLPADKKYVLTYFLGPQPKIVHTEVRKQAEESGAEVIEMMDWRSPYYILGPHGFLEMIDRAQAVFTDSFHGTVFCILFHKPFYIYQRFENDGRDANMFSRIDTLLSKTGLTQCAVEHRPPTEEEFARADKLLEKERAFSLRFLQEALSDTTVMN